MENNNIVDLDEDDAKIILFLFFISESSKEAYSLWDEFEKEIKYNNRFFPKATILERIRLLAEDAATMLKIGSVFYRARKFPTSFLDYEGNNEERSILLDYVKKHYPDVVFNQAGDFYRFANLDSTIGFTSDFRNLYKTITGQVKDFWGYNEADSDAPSSKKTKNIKNGRANPSGISVLYLAEDEKTAIYEVRPFISQDVSVAQIELTKNLKIFDFCKYVVKEDEPKNSLLLQMLSVLFSEVTHENEMDYLPSQYLCAYIHELGFDGIRFESSLNQDGKNIVLFDVNDEEHQNYKIKNSKVYNISNYNIGYQQVAPFVDSQN